MAEKQPPTPNDEKEYWLDKPSTGNLIFWGLVVVCVGVGLADALYHKHAHFKFEGWFGFYGLFGFVASIGLILAAKQMRNILKREEDYYDR